MDQYFFSRIGTVYAVPVGTGVTLPDNLRTSSILEMDVAWDNGICYASRFGVFNDPGFSSVKLDGGGYVLGIALDKRNDGPTPDGSSIDELYAGTIFFYVPEEGGASTENPFAASSAPNMPNKTAFTEVAANAY